MSDEIHQTVQCALIFICSMVAILAITTCSAKETCIKTVKSVECLK
jgi:hypothetical protein